MPSEETMNEFDVQVWWITRYIQEHPDEVARWRREHVQEMETSFGTLGVVRSRYFDL